MSDSNRAGYGKSAMEFTAGPWETIRLRSSSRPEKLIMMNTIPCSNASVSIRCPLLSALESIAVATFFGLVLGRAPAFADGIASNSPAGGTGFNRYTGLQDNDLVNFFEPMPPWYPGGLHASPAGGVSGGSALGPSAEITVYAFAIWKPAGLRNLPGDESEVSAFFKLESSAFRPASEGEFSLYFAPSVQSPALEGLPASTAAQV